MIYAEGKDEDYKVDKYYIEIMQLKSITESNKESKKSCCEVKNTKEGKER